ncbi:glycosyltransferases [Proteiniphilum saccharofermentans]|uniref:Glycosyltransferases n=1 Tax=Proteiniphilum saccharofermentans TaxID=1642647 RepID=A0A1R3T605_9BACT|nr:MULTISPECIES: glycosyltransferase [Proteiniphilum]SCD21652.1 glycosyltransferases [Proteiniphilum saccharofermentans]
MKEIICVTTYPPRECGIATFSDDLIRAIEVKFGSSFTVKVCALASQSEQHTYGDKVKYVLNTSEAADFPDMARRINEDPDTEMVLIQHEFGLFAEHETAFLKFAGLIRKPLIIVFHTVLPNPSPEQKKYLRQLARRCSAVIAMTQTSAEILEKDYDIEPNKINIIPHGTHLVSHKDKKKLKEKYKVTGRRILTTFGLLSPGKSLETTLEALPDIIKENPTVLFLIIGKTHPTILKTVGEAYRDMLKARVVELGLTDYVRFVNLYLDLPVLLEYLQLTDVYLFTSADPNQAVSGTFVYALSCGCPIIATPIPHALELLKDNSGLIFDFKNSGQLAKATNRLLKSKKLRSGMRIAGLQKTAETAWENTAIAYTRLFNKELKNEETLIYSLPPVNPDHIKRMSSSFAMIQFSKGNRPDIRSGYTLDDNARALVALCRLYVETKDVSCEKYIKKYLDFIRFCQQADGTFLNYVDKDLAFTAQNDEDKLEDSNARAIYALGYFISQRGKFPDRWTEDAIETFEQTFDMIMGMRSPRSIGFAIKGLFYFQRTFPGSEVIKLITVLAERLTSCYRQNREDKWKWFEAYLTYDNSILPESLLYAYQITKNNIYRKIAEESFHFLLDNILITQQIKVVSNQGWLQKAVKGKRYGEQPIDIAGTVIALSAFYSVSGQEEYREKQKVAFSWFLGNNHLHQIIYNPVTGGCYDGLEEHNVNLNQGAESAVSYLMARLCMNDNPINETVKNTPGIRSL